MSVSKERGKKVGHSETPERPRFPGCPLRVGRPAKAPQSVDQCQKAATRPLMSVTLFSMVRIEFLGRGTSGMT